MVAIMAFYGLQGAHGDERFSMERIYCPSEEEYSQLKKEFKIKVKGIEEGYSCNDPDNLKARLAKILFFIENYAQIDVPSWWMGGATKALKNTKEYLKKRIRKISFIKKSSMVSKGKNVTGYNIAGKVYFKHDILKRNNIPVSFPFSFMRPSTVFLEFLLTRLVPMK